MKPSGPGMLLDGKLLFFHFNFLIVIGLFIFLFLHDLVLVGCIFLGIYSFLLVTQLGGVYFFIVISYYPFYFWVTYYSDSFHF